MSWDRIIRQEAILREKIAVLVQRLNDPRLGFVTITSTKLSRDKHYCTVKFTVLGSEGEERKTTRALADAAPRVREMLAPSLHTRVLPELRFEYDREVVKESRLRTLIEEVTAERVEREGPDVDSTDDAAGDPAQDPLVDPVADADMGVGEGSPGDEPAGGREPAGPDGGP